MTMVAKAVTPTAPRASLRQLRKSYGKPPARHEVLQGIDLDLMPGSLTLLEGPSGSGKSTILNILGLLDRADDGEIEIDGRLIGDLPEKKLAAVRNEQIGYIFQSADLIPRLSALENVRLPLEIRGVRKTEANERSLAMLGRLGMRELAGQAPETLSGGQCQRVAVARALVTGPSLLIADEPTSNLDTENALLTVQVIRDLCHELGTTALLATHDSRLRDQADQIVHLRDGAIVETAITANSGEA